MRPVMGSQPNLTSRSQVVSIYKCLPLQKKLEAPPQNSRRKKWTTFRDFRTRHRISPEWNVASTNQNAIVSIYSVSPKSWPTFRDLWPRNGWDPFRHCDPPYENSTFSIIAGLPTQRPLNPDQMLEGLKGLLHRKITWPERVIFYRIDGHYVATIIVATCLVTRRVAIASPSIRLALRRVLTAFTRPAITPPKVNRFGRNLEERCELNVGGRPWQTLGAIRTLATVWEGAEILFFGHLNYAQFHRFPVGQFSRILHTTTSIGVAM